MSDGMSIHEWKTERSNVETEATEATGELATSCDAVSHPKARGAKWSSAPSFPIPISVCGRPCGRNSQMAAVLSNGPRSQISAPSRCKLLGWFKIASLRKTRSLWTKWSRDTVAERGGRNEVPVLADRKTMKSLTISEELGHELLPGIQSFTTSEQSGQELLPGIPDDITLNWITTKLSWRDIQIMSSVSLGWRQATRNHVAYDARVRAQSTETLAVWFMPKPKSWDSKAECENKILLRSMAHKFSLQLPSIRGLGRQWPFYGDCVSLKGKVYIFGGALLSRNYSGSTQVHVMDLAAHSLSWTLVESHSFPEFGQAHRVEFMPCRTTSTRDDEHLFVHAHWYTTDLELSCSKDGCLYQSRGSCKDDKEIVWEKAKHSCSSRNCFVGFAFRASTCTVQV